MKLCICNFHVGLSVRWWTQFCPELPLLNHSPFCDQNLLYDNVLVGGMITFSDSSSSIMFSKCFCLKNVNPFPNKPWFSCVCRTSLLKTLWEKEKLLVTSNFSFSHSVFYHLDGLTAIFIKFEIVVCKLFHFGRV